VTERDSSIYDLGYRHYAGARLGRRGTLTTLYVHGLRAVFGLGRKATSKILPIGLTVLAFIPAVIQLGVGALTDRFNADIELFKHEDYFDYVQVILVLFCAAVAPELVGRDQRSRTLSLYFSRSLTRLDYVLAKLAALVTAMLVLTLGPQVVLYVGNGMIGDDVPGYLADSWDLVPPILGGALVVSVAIASIGLAIAAYLPRRAYASTAIVGAYLLTLAAGNILMETIDPSAARWAQLVGPLAWEGAIAWLFRVELTGQPFDDGRLDGWVYLTAIAVLAVVSVALTVRRLRRVTA
jgi:ABC-2 type transport system permease protein